MLGEGILQGMIETARNLVGSYVSRERLVTVQYPEEQSPLPENARSFPFLVYDGDDAALGLRCVACQICEKECPPQCIYIVKDSAKKPDATGRLQFQPKVFDIDISVCMSCQICVEVCPFDAIKMDTEFELGTDDRFGGLLLDKRQLSKPNSHYQRVHPTDAAEVDGRLQAAAKRARAAAEAKAARPPATPVARNPDAG
jgi:NADH-quinone oxidoreductase subunit I